MTGKHNCASDRVSEASYKIHSDWIVEVQGDEPLLWPEIIDEWLDKCLKYIRKKYRPFLINCSFITRGS